MTSPPVAACSSWGSRAPRSESARHTSRVVRGLPLRRERVLRRAQDSTLRLLDHVVQLRTRLRRRQVRQRAAERLGLAHAELPMAVDRRAGGPARVVGHLAVGVDEELVRMLLLLLLL